MTLKFLGFKDKVVVTVGIDNSSGDIAVELGRLAEKVRIYSFLLHQKIAGLRFNPPRCVDHKPNRRLRLADQHYCPLPVFEGPEQGFIGL